MTGKSEARRMADRLTGEERGRVLLDVIYDEVDQRLNWNPEECWHCGGEGYTFDCFDGCCLEADIGCEDCARRCPECAEHKRDRLKSVREAVIQSGDIDVAREWLKGIGRWTPEITDDQIRTEIKKARRALQSGGDE